MRLASDEFAYCEGCGEVTGFAEHKPERLCPLCRPEPLWAEPGDLLLRAGRVGLLVSGGCEVYTVLVESRLEAWPLASIERTVSGGEATWTP